MTYNNRICKCIFQHNAATPFRSIFSASESDDLIALCKNVFNRSFTNGIGVRLDYCNQENQASIVGLSEVRFFDFLLSNFALLNYEKLLLSASASQARSLKRLKERFTYDGNPDSVGSILQREYLANTLAVSFLISDRAGQFLLTKRNATVGISSGFVSVTVTGAIDDNDYSAEDPFRNCCQRELLEEMDYMIDRCAITPFMIVCGEKKLQPIVLANAQVESISEIVERITAHKGFSIENSGYAIYNRDDISHLLADGNVRITEAARTHLESAINVD